ncbi:hypothetical protein PHYSODRAFT_523941 [Phytophthora sojae]|uniref:DDE-1 domain-containing protein n=1 Tax=Phytophthora sojae (strain P6497) TaxID=1094619 RepID=G5A2E4_PHYSP|nr:hypothetical protein PHYSODRAFT_523941 [Phytophthora sojae]EGZ09835.1 hypothetical protein PHYSODRAFT_523941 [Phytophthora sojae]|eukprot:XP_009534696.1 hypothetical protein PHYSODRAFT_523941 [Phytophthora sojae]
MSSSSKTRTRLTQQQKLRLIKKAESSPTVKYEDLALWAKVEFGLQSPPGKATIGRIISGRIALLRQPHESAQRKNKPSPFQLQTDQNIVDGAMIVFYATVLAKKLGTPRHTVDLPTAMKWCESAWDNVSASTIQKCWLHSTLISKSSVSFILN